MESRKESAGARKSSPLASFLSHSLNELALRTIYLEWFLRRFTQMYGVLKTCKVNHPSHSNGSRFQTLFRVPPQQKRRATRSPHLLSPKNSSIQTKSGKRTLGIKAPCKLLSGSFGAAN